jgi:hypothetical protein
MSSTLIQSVVKHLLLFPLSFTTVHSLPAADQNTSSEVLLTEALRTLTTELSVVCQALAGRFMLGDQEVVLDVAPDDPLPLKVEALRQYLEATLGTSKFKRYAIEGWQLVQKGSKRLLATKANCIIAFTPKSRAYASMCRFK